MRIKGLGSRGKDLGLEDLGFRVWDLGSRVWDLGLKGLGFRV